MSRYLLYLITAGLLLYTAGTSLTQVQPGERAVIRRFGRILDAKPEPGLYIGWPWGIEQVTIVRVSSRSIKVGFEDQLDTDDEVVPAGQLLTGDHNLVNVQAVIDYKVREAEVDKFVLQTRNIDALVARASEALLAEWIAGRKVDEVLTRGKIELPVFLLDQLQQRLEDYDVGLEIERASIIDKRIAAALADQDATQETLVTLWDEAVKAHDDAERTIKTETARSLDINNPDPDKSIRLIERAKLTMQRLGIAANEFSKRVAAIEKRDYATEWHAEADRLKSIRDALADDLVALYPRVVSAISALYAKIDANWADIDALHRRAPEGEERRLADAELAARELSGYTASQPRVRDNLKLPSWSWPSVIAYPTDPFAEFQRQASLVLTNAVKAMERKQSCLYGPDWFEGKKLQDEERRKEIAKMEEEEMERRAKSQEDYYAALRRHEQLRLGIKPDANGATGQ